MPTKWHITGDYVLACNCDYGCPCNFNARPTMGFCQGAVGFQVPVTKAEALPRVVLPQGFVFQEGEQYALKEFWANASPELTFAHPGKCGELAKVRWQGP